MNTPTVTLRPFRSTDLDTLFRIDQVCFPRGIAYGMRELRLFLQLEDSHCIVAEVTGGVAGGNAGQVACEIAGFILSQCSTQLAHVITLDVLQAHRRQSIGSQLLQTSEALAASQGARLMYLETATTNKAAIALWKKHGYREAGLIENYYGPGMDAYEMQKLLGRSMSAGRA